MKAKRAEVVCKAVCHYACGECDGATVEAALSAWRTPAPEGKVEHD
jgi:hypothetical protein